MYVCICHAVPECEVEYEIAAGARTVEEVGQRCYAGTGCGGCQERIREMLRVHADRARMPLQVAV